MKRLFVIMSLVFCFRGFAQVEFFDHLDKSSLEYNTYSLALEKAREFINEAAPKMNSKGQTFAQQVLNSLRNPEFRVAAHAVAIAFCDTFRSGAFVNKNYLNTIFMCHKTRSHAQNSQSSKVIHTFSQLFIHEGAHLAGESNECNATYFEIGVMRNTAVGIQSRASIDRYDPECNFNL